MFLPAGHSHVCLDHLHRDLIPFLFRMHSLFRQSVGLIFKFKFIKLDVYIEN